MTSPLHRKNVSVDCEHFQKQTGKRAAEQRANYRNRRITPVRPAFTRNWQNCMCKPRTKIARRIDGVARRSAQRQTDAPNETRNEVRPEAGRWTSSGYALRKNRADHKNKHK